MGYLLIVKNMLFSDRRLREPGKAQAAHIKVCFLMEHDLAKQLCANRAVGDAVARMPGANVEAGYRRIRDDRLMIRRPRTKARVGMDDIDVCNAREEPHRALCNGPHHEIVAGCSITGIFAEANERVMAAGRLDQEADAVRLHKGRNCTLCIALVADERIAQLLGLSACDVGARLNDQKVALHRCDRNVEICHLRDKVFELQQEIDSLKERLDKKEEK